MMNRSKEKAVEEHWNKPKCRRVWIVENDKRQADQQCNRYRRDRRRTTTSSFIFVWEKSQNYSAKNGTRFIKAHHVGYFLVVKRMSLFQVHWHPEQDSVHGKLNTEKAKPVQDDIGRSKSFQKGYSLLGLFLRLCTILRNFVFAVFFILLWVSIRLWWILRSSLKVLCLFNYYDCLTL